MFLFESGGFYVLIFCKVKSHSAHFPALRTVELSETKLSFYNDYEKVVPQKVRILMTTKAKDLAKGFFRNKTVHGLKEEAKASQSSLNSYIEKVLAYDIGNIPNEDTKAAIEEARNGNLERIDNIEDWFKKL